MRLPSFRGIMKFLEILKEIQKRNPSTPKWAKDRCPIGGCKLPLEPVVGDPETVGCAAGHAFDKSGKYIGRKLLNEGIDHHGQI